MLQSCLIFCCCCLLIDSPASGLLHTSPWISVCVIINGYNSVLRALPGHREITDTGLLLEIHQFYTAVWSNEGSVCFFLQRDLSFIKYSVLLNIQKHLSQIISFFPLRFFLFSVTSRFPSRGSNPDLRGNRMHPWKDRPMCRIKWSSALFTGGRKD